jgi:hypothetical protein
MFQGETVTAERFAAQPALSKTNKKPVFSHLEKCLKGQKRFLDHFLSSCASR